MRKILFRGKMVHNGLWTEGSLIVWPDGETDICTRQFSSEETQLYKMAVSPETVGQFTGLRDKNGIPVFEGDILKIAKLSDGAGGYYYPPIDYPVNVVVKWDYCALMWETLCEDKRYIGFPEAWCRYVCEIVGNIHDNPELMGGIAHE